MSLVAAWAVPLLLLGLRAYRRSTLASLRYRLFAVRDDLYGLVASGVIDEGDGTFRMLADMMNLVLANTSQFTLEGFAESIVRADRAAQADAARAVDNLWRADERVLAVAIEFFAAVVAVMEQNSLRLRSWLRVRELANDHANSVKALARRRPAWYDGYLVSERWRRQLSEIPALRH